MPGSHKPLISVITPAYNHGRFVQDTVRSILNQDYENLEYIIIDDGSPDDTASKIEGLAGECRARFRNFIFERQTNSGIVRTLNRALKHAQGEFVFFLASDDLADRQAISKLFGFLESHPDYALVVPDNRIIDSAGRECYWTADQHNSYNREEARFATFGEFLQARRPDFRFNSDDFGRYWTLIRGNYFPGGPLVRRSVLEHVGGFSEQAPLEDYYLMMQISKISKLKFLDQPLLSYRWHDNNTVRDGAKMLNLSFATTSFEKDYCRENGLMWDWYRVQLYYLIKFIRQAPSNLQNYTPPKLEILVMGLIPLLSWKVKKIAKKLLRRT